MRVEKGVSLGMVVEGVKGLLKAVKPWPKHPTTINYKTHLEFETSLLQKGDYSKYFYF